MKNTLEQFREAFRVEIKLKDARARSNFNVAFRRQCKKDKTFQVEIKSSFATNQFVEIKNSLRGRFLGGIAANQRGNDRVTYLKSVFFRRNNKFSYHSHEDFDEKPTFTFFFAGLTILQFLASHTRS